jgi:hypothetical protein
LSTLLKVYDTSLSSATTTPIAPGTIDAALAAGSDVEHEAEPTSPTSNKVQQRRQHPLEILLQSALSPFLSAALLLASRLPLPKSSILSLNTLSAIHATLSTSFTSSSSSPTAPLLPSISSLAASHSALLSDHILAEMLHASGLEPIFDALLLIPPDDTDALASLPLLGKKKSDLSAAARRLDSWLPGATMAAAEETRGLRAMGVVTPEEVRARAADGFVEGFVGVVERIEAVDAFRAEGDKGQNGDAGDEDEELERLRDVFPRTAQDIAVLLS